MKEDQIALGETRIIPVGTQVVIIGKTTSANLVEAPSDGALGIIVKAPSDNTHSYRIRFPDGTEASLRRNEFVVRKQHQAPPTDGPRGLADADLSHCVIYRCIIGSRAYGLDHAGSDIDRRGIYLPPAERHWSLYGVPEQFERKETEECYWEIQKFLLLALKANPNILECLYTPLVEYASPMAEELLAMRAIFLSKLVYQTYSGYVMSQFKKLEHDQQTTGAIKWKHAMHLIRLLLSGITVLKEAYVPVRIDQYREELLAIRRGEMGWDDVNAWRLSLHKEFDHAFASTSLPDRPDYHQANEFLIKARYSAINQRRERQT